nr:carboxypeptidase regulatory-like domain-containing protein [Bacteroidota bacterium]
MNSGNIDFKGTENSIIYVKSENAWFNNLEISKSDGAFVAYDNTPGIEPLRVKGQFIIYNGAKFIHYAMYNSIFEGPFLAYPGSDFAFTNGTAIFDYAGSGGIVISSEPGNYFHDVVMSCADWMGLSGDIEIRGDLLIEEGIFRTLGYDVYIKGDWTDNSGFNHGNSRVIFNGGGVQEVNGENFWEMEIDKAYGELRFHENYSSVQHYIWTDGTIRVNGGELDVFDMENDGIYGTIIVTAGQIDLWQDPGNFIDLNGNLEISGGIMNVYGGSDLSYWPFSENGSITMSDGILNFDTKGIRVHNTTTYDFDTDITGGTIRTGGDFMVYRDDFDPTGGTIEFYGYDEDADLTVNESSNLFNIVVDKSSKDGDAIAKTLIATGILNLDGDFILNGGSFEAPNQMFVGGMFLNNQSPAHFDEMTGEVILDGSVSYSLNDDEVFYDLTFDNPGTLTIPEGNTLTVSNLFSIDDGLVYFEPSTHLILQGGMAVNYGGALHLMGEPADEIYVNSNYIGNYAFDVNPGGEIAAETVIFSYPDVEGIHIHSGGYVLADHAFNNCTFAYGLPGGTMMTLNSGANLIIHDANFYTNTTGMTYNVVKTVDNGEVYFDEATGDFSGEAFENDPYNRIDWEYNPPFELPFFEDWSSASFDTQHWTAVGSNWQMDEAYGNPAPSAKFTFSPTQYDYSFQLRTHEMNATEMETVFLKYDIAYETYSTQTLEQLSVRFTFPNGDYYTLANYDNQGGSFDFITEEIDISEYAQGEIFLITFVAHGENSYNIEKWNVDNIELTGELAEPGKYTGKLKDSETDLPIENALVELDGTSLSTLTNQYGKFTFVDLQPGIYSATMTADGYFGINPTGIEVLAGQTTTINYY